MPHGSWSSPQRTRLLVKGGCHPCPLAIGNPSNACTFENVTMGGIEPASRTSVALYHPHPRRGPRPKSMTSKVVFRPTVSRVVAFAISCLLASCVTYLRRRNHWASLSCKASNAPELHPLGDRHNIPSSVNTLLCAFWIAPSIIKGPCRSHNLRRFYSIRDGLHSSKALNLWLPAVSRSLAMSVRDPSHWFLSWPPAGVATPQNFLTLEV